MLLAELFTVESLISFIPESAINFLLMLHVSCTWIWVAVWEVFCQQSTDRSREIKMCLCAVCLDWQLR